MSAKIVWATGEAQIAYLARVSNSKAQPDDPGDKLIAFLIRNRHWSPFEMASMCVEINTTRDIGRQILRHRSFSFQEFSQRYAEVDGEPVQREMRSAGSTNRQGSLDQQHPLSEDVLMDCAKECFSLYRQALANGVAPECARAILPEGFTPTRMYMKGTVRSWIHYLQERTQLNAQKEHRLIAEEIKSIFKDRHPLVFKAVFEQ
jgi:thymidylate synthase (FAD)